jgi:hypothetical protein
VRSIEVELPVRTAVRAKDLDMLAAAHNVSIEAVKRSAATQKLRWTGSIVSGRRSRRWSRPRAHGRASDPASPGAEKTAAPAADGADVYGAALEQMRVGDTKVAEAGLNVLAARIDVVGSRMDEFREALGYVAQLDEYLRVRRRYLSMPGT